ncbi:MAG: BREX-2 system phosphatase PglZ, partial [Polyangiaceae bacterium]|nr:BREX-2 system phosphatase PglZ [Polyangiaceae bacterium]
WGEHAPADLAVPRRRVLDRCLEVRDALNRRFAAALARDEVAAYRNATLPEPLPLHLVTRALIRPLVEAEHRVLLLVLDGCDLSSLYELLRSRRDVNAGLCRPAVTGQLAADLGEAGCLHVGLSPLPTVTSHARRALFAGDIPQNPVLDETESEAANARADADAWARNSALRGIPHRLMLKGDLGPDGAHVVEALEEGREQVLAAVFNGIDDALSSHEITAMGPWTYGDLGHGLRAVLNAAVRKGWIIVVTSDHGHTPFWSTDRKAAARASSQRYGASPLPGSVSFPGVSMRPAPIHLLTAVGAYAGHQRRGFHGGAGLEEVIVPIAVLGNATVPETRPQEPDWWARTPEALAAPGAAAAPATAAPIAAPPAPVVTASLLPVDYRAAFSDQPRQLKVLELLAEKGVLTNVQVGKVIDKKPNLAHGFIKDMEFRFHRLRLPVPFTVEEQQSEMVYRWKIRS